MTPHINALEGEIAKVVIMPGDPLRAKYIAENYLKDYKLVNTVRNIYAYTGYYNDKLVIINIKSHLGDKIKLNLPIDFVKKLIKNNALDFFLFEEEIVDTQKMIKSLVDAFNYNLTGDVVHLERYNGDIINIRIQ